MNQYTFPVLKRLSDGKFHSGEVLAAAFGVSRATIWNAIQHAQALGIAVFSVPGRGYKLPQAVAFIDERAVLTAIGPDRDWFHLHVLDEVSSTNAYLMQQAAQGAPHVSCVVAHMQTQGRGRRGRKWVSHLGASLTFSLLWRFACGAAALSGLSLVVGVALMRALQALGVSEAQLKWPNDVMVRSGNGYKKLAGILIELQGDMDSPSAAVIGVGINCALPETVLKQIDQPALDLASLGVAIEPSTLLGLTLKHMAEALRNFETQGFAGVREEWLRYHAYQHQPVLLLMPDGRHVQGVATGVAEDGILLVETALGLQRFSAGEISLRSVAVED